VGFYLISFENESNMEWLNINGLYSFYKNIIGGNITFKEWGDEVEKRIELEYERIKLIDSKQT